MAKGRGNNLFLAQLRGLKITFRSTLSFRRALNLRRHSTVSCLCIMDATVERCCRIKQELQALHTTFSAFSPILFHLKILTWRLHYSNLLCTIVVRSTKTLTQIQGCLRACSAVILLAGLMVNIWLIRFFASGVTVSHSGDGNWEEINEGTRSCNSWKGG